MSMIAIHWTPDAKKLRTFGFVTALFLAALAGLVFFRHSLFGWTFEETAARWGGMIVWGTAVLCLLLAMTLPKALLPVYIVLNAVALPVGIVLSHVVLGVIYYGVFTPVGLLFRLIGRDALHRKFDPQAETYWVPTEPNPPAKRYFRQF